MAALRRLLGATIAMVTTAAMALVWTPAPAHADEAWETALKTTMSRTATWAEGGLAQVGLLGQPLPLLGVSPGALVDVDALARRASDALASGLTKDNVDLGGGTRLTSSVTTSGGDHLLDVLLTAKREVVDKDLTLAGVTLDKAVSVTGWATLHLRVRHTAAGETYLVRDGDTPRIDIDAAARLRADLDQATASVGILGVTLTAGSTLTARTHVKVTLTDPNGDGRLAFDTAAGANTGELGAPGSLAGLVQVALDNSGGGKISDTETEPGPGSVHGVAKLGAATTGVPFALPTVAATVTVDWDDISVGTPTVTTTGLNETIAKFGNMSPLDLASGLAQLATLLSGVQQSGPAGNLNLPFLRGTFADAVKVNEKLTDFLRKYVHPRPEDPQFRPGEDDPALAGQPKFSSIQELVALLAAEGLPVDNLSFDNGKLVFRLTLERESTVEVPLDPGAAELSGRGATFTAKGFSVSGDRFTPGALVGQRVVAGTSAGTVAANTADSVTLTGDWIGGQPPNDSVWVISGSSPNIGAVELAGTLAKPVGGDKRVGLREANAQASFATVKPRYRASVTLVLDLRDGPGSPAPADRVLLRTDPATPLFAADFPITTGVDFFATAGFLKVKLAGNLAVGPAASGDRMLQVSFKQAQDISLGTLFERLKSDPGNLLAVSSSVKTTGRVAVSVPGATGALGEGIGVDVSWTAGGQPVVDTSALSGLFAADFNPDDPKALFAVVVEALRLINAALSQPGGGSGPLDKEIPLLGRSARQLLGGDESGVGKAVTFVADGANFLLKDASRDDDSGFDARLEGRTVVIGSKAYRVLNRIDGQTLRVEAAGTPKPTDGSAYALRPELADALDQLLASPPDNLQDVLDKLNAVIGEDSGISFTLDQREGGPFLRLGLDWKRKFHTGGPLNFAWDAHRELITLDSSGTFAVDVDARAQLGLLLPLRLNAAPLLDHNSSASVTVAGGVTDAAIAARVGPLALDLGKDPDFATVKANLSVGLDGLTEDGPISGLLGLTPKFTTAGVDCGGVGGENVPLCAKAPLFVNNCDPADDTNLLTFAVALDLTPTAGIPNLDSCFANLSLKLTDFNVGIDGYLARIEEALRLASFDGKLPLVGDDLQQGQRFVAQLREDIKAAIGPVLANATLDSAGVQTALNEVLADLDPGVSAVVSCRTGVTAPCAPEDFQSIRIKLISAKGAPSAATGCADAGTNTCLGLDVPLDLGIPGLSLKAKKGAPDGIQAKLGWKLHLDLVLDRDEGFYVPTHDGDASPEVQVGAQFDMTGDLAAQLAFIQVTATKRTTDPLVKAYFGIDLKGSPGEKSCFDPTVAADCTANPDDRLTLAEFADLGSLLATDLTAQVKIDWKLAAAVDTGGEDSALPGISANFGLHWGLEHKRGGLTATGDGVTTPLKVTFTDIALDAGAFFDKILKPVVEKLKAVTGPLQPVIDTLYAPIPVLSDLSKATGGPDITLVWLAKTFSTLNGGPKLDFIDTVRAVVTFVNRIPDCDSGCSIPLGAFKMDSAKALTTEVSPASAESLIDRTSDYHPASGAQVKEKVDEAAGDDGEKLFTPTADGENNAQKTGFSFPIFDNPGSLFGLLLGQDVELISFDSGPLALGFSWRQSFGPVYAPPPVFVTLSGSASVTARFIAGLDTAGIRHAIEAATDGTSVDAVSLLDGLYFKTADSSGKPVPVVTLTGEIAAGAEVSVLIVKVGIEGGIRLTVGFSWNDPNNDGKFRTSEFLQALLNNPICLFTTSGRLSVFLRVYVTINLFLFKKKFNFTLVDATLLDFRAQPDCSPPPPELAGTAGDTLVVFAGKFGKKEQRGDKAWDNGAGTYAGDVVKVYALHHADAGTPGATDDFDGFAVEALGRRQEFLDPALTRVVVDGRGYEAADPSNTSLSVLLLGDGDTSGDGTRTSAFDKTAVVLGSDGKDRIRTGTGPAYVDGRGGDDVIVTAEAAGVVSRVAGGAGNDSITTGDGDNVVAGDSGLGGTDRGATTVRTGAGDKTLTGLVDWTTLTAPTADQADADADDHVTVGHGASTVYGNGGDDVLGVLVDDRPNGGNTLVGGSGADTVNGGKGDDTIHTYDTDVPADADQAGTGDAGLVNQVDTGAGQDTVHGSAGVDLVISHSANGQTGRVFGYGGDDVLVGGYGTDELFGGPGEDYVIAEPSQVGEADGTDGYGPFRQVTHEPLPANTQPQTKLLVGGLGSDHLIGGDGGSTVFGDRHLPAETCADATLAEAQPTPADQGAADLILGGAGTEVVTAGGGDDRADLGGGDDRACGQLGDDTLHLGGGTDRAWGGNGVDQLHGDDGDDLLFGNTGDDGLFGGPGADTAEGNAGGDQVLGGPDNDVLYGGGRAAGLTDGRDHLYGEDGTDRIVGDNGTPRIGDVGPYPLDLAGDDAGAGAGDVISGGGDADLVYGGLGDDRINGDGGDDQLEGNNGADLVHGDQGRDEIVGGSGQEPAAGVGRPDTGDELHGDADADLIAGDNARFAPATTDATRITQGRTGPPRRITLLDLGFAPTAGTSGGDLVFGGDGDDVLLGQGGPDRIHADAGADFAEGGPGSDWVEGNAGDDDLVGGSSTAYDGSGATTTGQPDTADALFGGPGSDAVIGDNGAVLRPLPGEQPTPVTVRLAADGSPFGPRIVVLLDRAAAVANRYGADRISGGDGVDTLWGQDGDDALTGDGDGDYAEGNGGADLLRGDSALTAAGRATVTALPNPGWPGTPAAAADLVGAGAPAGQDDLIGGSSAAGFRDTGDVVEGNGADDVLLGDNGSLLRTVTTVNGSQAEKVYTERYPTGAVPADATRVRTHDPALPGPATRFCTTAQATCEPTGAFGADQLYGDAGNDGVWGQDGDDMIRGGDGDDDIFGELGADTLYGDDGADAILGDRGGVMNQYLNADDVAALGFTATLSSVPQETFTGFRAGDYDRRVDLLHDTDGDAWIGSSTSAPMPHAGLTAGAGDWIRGGAGSDNIHAGFGDDVANGDSGGDQLFGSEGSDVLWGGKGCDPVLDAANPQCQVNGVFSAAARGDRDQYVDHLFGGAGATSGPAVTAVLSSDLLDFRPRGSYPDNCAAGAWPVDLAEGTVDPCRWFEMTGLDNDVVADNQHHHGTDWMYGGWDRDVMQGDVTANGPNNGDRMFDWNGAYNLFTHCNAAYGGFNDIRQHSPAMQDFLTRLAWATGAGRSATDVTTAGTSAFLELSYVYPRDNADQGAGKAFPGTPGHFDAPSCTD